MHSFVAGHEDQHLQETKPDHQPEAINKQDPEEEKEGEEEREAGWQRVLPPSASPLLLTLLSSHAHAFPTISEAQDAAKTAPVTPQAHSRGFSSSTKSIVALVLMSFGSTVAGDDTE